MDDGSVGLSLAATSAGTTVFVYNVAGQLIAEYTNSNQWEVGGTSYLTADYLGTPRVITKADGTIKGRHDYLPFGEEIGAGTGLRTVGQGFGATDRIRNRYALTERDDATGLEHTWFRKYENLAGRWTSPDPLAGSIGDPQSFNRYSYVQSDPVNLVDPSGLLDSWNCYVDGQPVGCGMAFSLLNMGAGRPEGGAGFYLDGNVFIVDTLDREHSGYTYWNAFLMDPQDTGFNLGQAANFTNDEKKILKAVNDRIKDKDCRDFINKVLADNRVAADRNTLDKLLGKADLNTYNEDLTNTQLGVSMDAMISLRDAFNNAGAPAASVDNHVFFVDLAFRRETTNLLPAFGTHNRNFDTATILVHELLHVAGLKDPQVQNLNRQIHEHCGFTGMSY